MRPLLTGPVPLVALGASTCLLGLALGRLVVQDTASPQLQEDAVRALLLTDLPEPRAQRVLRWLATTGDDRLRTWAVAELSRSAPPATPSSSPARPSARPPTPAPVAVPVPVAPPPPAELAVAEPPQPAPLQVARRHTPSPFDDPAAAAAALAPRLSPARAEPEPAPPPVGKPSSKSSSPKPASKPEPRPEPEPEPEPPPVADPEPKPAPAPQPTAKPQPAPLSRPPRPEATVTVGPPVLWGDIDPEATDEAIAARLPRWTACYQEALDDDPTLQGTLELQFDVTHGHVTDLVLGTDSLGDEVLTSCLTQVTRLLRFRSGQGEAMIPLVLRPKR